MAKKNKKNKSKELIVEYKTKGHIRTIDKVFNNIKEVKAHTAHYNIINYIVKDSNEKV